MKKVYFACSIAGGRDHAHVYGDIVGYIKEAGMHIVSEMFADKVLDKDKVGMNMEPVDVWKRDIDWITSVDAIIAEVTQPSLGVGYEIGVAEANNVPVLALFYEDSGRRLSPMVSGNPHVKVVRYKDVNETLEPIKEFVASL
jgi:hypothetical protein